MCAKSLQQRLEAAKAASPAQNLTPGQISHQVTNAAKKGVPTGVVTEGSFKEGNQPWNQGKTGTWGKTRTERGKLMTEEERKEYFGIIEQHTEKTIKQMKSSATKRWARTMRPVMADGCKYENHYAAGEAMGIHKDTVIYRIRATSDRWRNWYYAGEQDE